MAKQESWLKRNIVAIIAATIAALGVGVIWYNGNKPAPPAAMTATASGGGTAVNATSGATVQVGPSATGQAASQTVSPALATPAATPAAAAGAPGAMHASAGTGGTAVNATGSAQVTVHKASADGKP